DDPPIDDDPTPAWAPPDAPSTDAPQTDATPSTPGLAPPDASPGPARTKRFAVVTGLAGLVLVAAVVAVVVAGGSRSTPKGEAAPPHPDGYVLLSSLKAGDCFTTNASEPDGPYVYPGPCDNPHEGEVVAKATLSSGPFPGIAKASEQAAAVCEERTPEKVRRVAKKDFKPRNDIPSEKRWHDGDRGVTCALLYVGGSALTTPLGDGGILSLGKTDLHRGDCVEKWQDDGYGQPLVECTEKHEYQVLGFSKMDGVKAYPSAEKMANLAAEACAKLAVEVWGSEPPLDRVEPQFASPTKEGWESGDRGVTCLIGGKNGKPLTRSYVPKE
ncbi:hypothetical protein E1293_45655, partial [Actinomadura darangshiensis]